MTDRKIVLALGLCITVHMFFCLLDKNATAILFNMGAMHPLFNRNFSCDRERFFGALRPWHRTLIFCEPDPILIEPDVEGRTRTTDTQNNRGKVLHSELFQVGSERL